MWNINFTYKQQIHFQIDNTDKNNKNKKKPKNIKRFL